MLKNWIRKVASYFFSPFFILNCRRAGNKGRLRDIKNQHCVFTCPLMPTSFFFFLFLVSSAVEAVHGSSSAWCRGQTELKRSGLEAQFCSWQGLWEVMGWVGEGKRSKWVVRGGRLPCHPKEPADLEVGGRWGKRERSRLRLQLVSEQTENPETPISRGLFPPIYIFLVTIELEHNILVLIIFKSGRRPLEACADCAHFCAWLPQTTPWSEQCNCHSLIYHKMSAPVIAGCEIIFNFL